MDRGEDGDSGDGKLVDEVKKKKKRAKKENSEDVEDVKGGRRGVGEGAKVNSRDYSTKKQQEDKNEDKEGSTAVSLSRSEGQRFEEGEAKTVSKKQRANKKKDAEKEEGETDKVERKRGEESGSSTRANQLNGDGNVRTDSKRGQSNPLVVLCLSRRDSPNKKTREKAKSNGKKPGEGRKRKSSRGEPEFDGVRTSGLKKKRASGEEVGEKDSKICRLPLNRVRTIVRSDNSNIKITQESYFLICKATECFIERFCEDAFFLAASHGLKKLLKYDHLASLVYNMDRYDFLSDYVPRKIKAKEALAETKAAEDRQA